MAEWQRKLFVDRVDLFIKLMNTRWQWTERFVDGIIAVLNEHHIKEGNILDLCCGNGRISTNLAKKGFNVTGIDYSAPIIEDAVRKARENGVADKTEFIVGDVRNLSRHIKGGERFDAVVSAWTSIGYNEPDDDLKVFSEARKHSRESSLLFVVDTMHAAKALLEGSSSSLMEFEDVVLSEKKRFDHLSSRLDSEWVFYRRSGSDLVFVDALEYGIHVYGVSELSALLDRAGWSVEACYGSIISRIPFSASTGMNLVSIRKG